MILIYFHHNLCLEDMFVVCSRREYRITPNYLLRTGLSGVDRFGWLRLTRHRHRVTWLLLFLKKNRRDSSSEMYSYLYSVSLCIGLGKHRNLGCQESEAMTAKFPTLTRFLNRLDADSHAHYIWNPKSGRHIPHCSSSKTKHTMR